MLCMLNTSVYAADNYSFDLTKKGNVSINMRYNSEVVPGGSLTIFKVADIADIEDSDGVLSFVLTQAFQPSKADLSNISDSTLALNLEAYSIDNNISGDTLQISDQGNVTFTGLDTGLYLFSQQTPADGYKKITPFLVSMPMNSSGIYLYNIDASPKVQLSKVPIVPSQPYVEKPKESKLPQTGQLKWPVPVFMVIGLLLLIIGWIMRFGLFRKQKK